MIMVERFNLVKWESGYAGCQEITKDGKTFDKKVYLREDSPEELAKEVEHIKTLNLKRVFLIAQTQLIPELKRAVVARFEFPNLQKGVGCNNCIAYAPRMGDKTWVWVKNAIECGMTAVYKYEAKDEEKVIRTLRDNLAAIGIKADIEIAYVFFSGK